jgi:hypothetical protein
MNLHEIEGTQTCEAVIFYITIQLSADTTL